jgi:hypothetical protein
VIRTDASVIVVACGSAKADHARPAAELYTGALFRAARRAAEADGRPWLICSAHHGLVEPGRWLDPYEQGLPDTPTGIAALGALIAGQRHLVARAGGRNRAGVEVWAPARYTAALSAGGVTVRVTPLAGLGIGAQIGWLTRHAESCADYHQRTGTRPGPVAAARWMARDTGLVYAGSLTAQQGQPVVDMTDGRWVDTGDLLGLTYLNVALANGATLLDVHPDHLAPAPDPECRGAGPGRRRTGGPPTPATTPTGPRTSPAAARGRVTTR